jgi:hypothetical protein
MSALVEASRGGELAFDLALWSAPAIGAALCLRRTPSGERGAWWLVLAACVAILLDKAVDLQVVLYRFSVRVFDWLDPGRELRDGPLDPRFAVLAIGALVALGLLILLARRDHALRGPKLVSLAGLALLVAWLGLRLAPAVRDRIPESAERGVELLCWLAILAGEIQSLRRVGRGSS